MCRLFWFDPIAPGLIAVSVADEPLGPSAGGSYPVLDLRASLLAINQLPWIEKTEEAIFGLYRETNDGQLLDAHGFGYRRYLSCTGYPNDTWFSRGRCASEEAHETAVRRRVLAPLLVPILW